MLKSGISKFKTSFQKKTISITRSFILSEWIMNSSSCSGLTNHSLGNITEDMFLINNQYEAYLTEDMPPKTRILSTYFTIFNGSDHRNLSNHDTVQLIEWSFTSLLTNNIPPAWSLSLSRVTVHSWARDCEDQAIYAEVVAVFGEKIKIALIEKILKLITEEPVNMGGVVLVNFVASSHIKVVPGSVYKAFLKIDNLDKEDFENTTTTQLIQNTIKDLLNDFLSFEFDAETPGVGSVDWSYNITYKPETFKVTVMPITSDRVSVYVLVAPDTANKEKIQTSLDNLIKHCTETYQVFK